LEVTKTVAIAGEENRLPAGVIFHFLAQNALLGWFMGLLFAKALRC